MGSFGLQNSWHPVWQRVVELVDEVIRDGMEGYLAGIPKLLQVLRLGPSSSNTTVETIASKNLTYSFWWNRRRSSWSCEADQQAVVSSSCLARFTRPGSVMDVASLLRILSTCRLDTLKMSATSAGDLDFRFLMISALVSGLILGMLTEAMLSINWWLKV